MDFLVTGGAGFIGSNIVHRLVSMGKKVRVLDNFCTGSKKNLQGSAGKIEVIEGDIRDTDTVKKAVRKVRNVLHLGALPSVPRSVKDPLVSNQTNVCGTLKLLIAARDEGVERFVFSSSSSVYGNTPTLPKREDMNPCPLSPYALQKLCGEHYCRIFFELYGLKTFALRYFNVFGPRQNPKSQYAAVIPLFIDAVLEKKPLTIYGDGKQTRDFTFVDDVVAANLCCCTAPESSAGGVYNVARGDRISVNHLAVTIGRILDIKPRISYEPRRKGDVRDSQADSTLARKKLGWKPKVGFEEGLKKTIDYYLSCRK